MSGPAPTLAKIREECATAFVWCNRCSHNALGDVDLLIARFGPDKEFPDVKAEMHCGACLSKDIHIQPNWSESSPGQVTRHT